MLLLLALSGAALAKPEAPSLFCEVYGDSPFCVSDTVSCSTCHAESGPPAHNPYGLALADQRDEDREFALWLPDALLAVQLEDSDGDGVDNLDEILGGSWPGFDSSVEPECSEQTTFDNRYYSLGRYDHDFAYKRVMLDFCGRSPRYEERLAFSQAVDPDAALQDTLDACLQSPYWDDVLREMAIRAVRPIGPATDINILGNWEWDVRLFAYALSGDRDARDLLRADYFVVEEPSGSGILAPIDEPRSSLESYAQPLPPEDRYGLITTRYSLAMHVMFSDMPRTLTAHVYRQILGLDLARSEGLYPVDELDGAYPWPAPADVDERGVWQEGCAGCHATLDAMSYPWVRYNGIDLDGDTTGVVLDERAADIVPSTEGYLFGEPVDGPEAWVELAVNSDAFARNITLLFWRYLMRREPYSCEQDQFDALWGTFREEGYVAEDMLRQLITLDAYGTP
ncbi:MAG: hypothetical protein H6741_16255 [Alphaproteobacteria bacterium]|nr:hypothetical protein [Alphaproteobacteria bacterium]MCB9794267.1 hypothetical protein [Alphaproteobacteria bacterium]